MKQEIIGIGGMTCAACAARLEKAIGKCEGVESVSVNLATEKASVSYNPDVVDSQGIRDVITKTGYTPLQSTKKAEDEDRVRRAQETKRMWTEFWVAAVFGALLLYVAMGPMLFSGAVPRAISPDYNPMAYAITQIVLVLPILVVGRRFYSVGFKALWQRSPNMDSLIAVSTTAALLYSFYNVYLIGQICMQFITSILRLPALSSPSSSWERPWRQSPAARPARPSRSSWGWPQRQPSSSKTAAKPRCPSSRSSQAISCVYGLVRKFL